MPFGNEMPLPRTIEIIFSLFVTQVKLKPRPWRVRYEIKDYLGIQSFETSRRQLYRATLVGKRPVKYDLMWHYRLVFKL